MCVCVFLPTLQQPSLLLSLCFFLLLRFSFFFLFSLYLTVSFSAPIAPVSVDWFDLFEFFLFEWIRMGKKDDRFLWEKNQKHNNWRDESDEFEAASYGCTQLGIKDRNLKRIKKVGAQQCEQPKNYRLSPYQMASKSILAIVASCIRFQPSEIEYEIGQCQVDSWFDHAVWTFFSS